jgi:hypothetical protein
MNVDPNQILQLLVPHGFWDFVLYFILLMGLIVLFMQPEGSVLTNILLALVIIGVFIDKVQAFPAHRCAFGTMLIRILYFVVPLIVAGVTKNGKSRAPAVIMAVVGLGYTLFLWATEMRNPAICLPLERDVRLIVDFVKVMLV